MNINFRLRNIFYLIIIGFFIWLLFIEKQILGPFIIAMIFAYIFNPLINFFAKYLKIPRSISILLVYVILIGSSIFIGILFTRSILSETDNISKSVAVFINVVKRDVGNLPLWAQPYLSDYLDYLSKNNFFEGLLAGSFPVVSQAFFGIIAFFVFLFSSFFFLKDGRKMVENFMRHVPSEYKTDAQVLLKKINGVLSRYLRGQLILILSMVVMLYVSLSFIGVKYALSISLFSALFEIVPFIGPVIAGVFAILLVTVSGGISNFPLNTLQVVLLVLLVAFVARQIQDYVIAPFVIGKATKLHPLVILFSVLAGQHIYGILGVLLAVPVAAMIKILLEFSLEKVNNRK